MLFLQKGFDHITEGSAVFSELRQPTMLNCVANIILDLKLMKVLSNNEAKMFAKAFFLLSYLSLQCKTKIKH